MLSKVGKAWSEYRRLWWGVKTSEGRSAIRAIAKTIHVPDVDEILSRGGDLHSEICAHVFGEVTPEGRALVKNTIFMLRYSTTARR